MTMIYIGALDVGCNCHSYIVYGPLANGVTTRCLKEYLIIPPIQGFGKYAITQRYYFLHCPTAIRALMKEGNSPVESTSRKSIRLLETVGEPINPEAWMWYFNIVGEKDVR